MNKKMLMLMAGGKGEKGRRVGVEYEDWGVKDNYPMIEPYSGGYGPYKMNYPMEDKFRDRRGREHYDDGRYAPRSTMEPEDRGYRRYSDGRFAPRSDYSDPWMDHRRTPTTFDEGERRMNPIGFARDGSDATIPQYHEMERMEGSDMSRGYSRSEYMPRFDRQMAEEWASNMENADGTRGPHWTLDQAKQVMAQKEIGGSTLAFWVALNATYSDLCKMFKKYGINTVDAYVDFAKDFWLEDPDAVPDKLAAYFTYVVKH